MQREQVQMLHANINMDPNIPSPREATYLPHHSQTSMYEIHHYLGLLLTTWQVMYLIWHLKILEVLPKEIQNFFLKYFVSHTFRPWGILLFYANNIYVS